MLWGNREWGQREGLQRGLGAVVQRERVGCAWKGWIYKRLCSKIQENGFWGCGGSTRFLVWKKMRPLEETTLTGPKAKCAKRFGLQCPFSAKVTVTNLGPEVGKDEMWLGDAWTENQSCCLVIGCGARVMVAEEIVTVNFVRWFMLQLLWSFFLNGWTARKIAP